MLQKKKKHGKKIIYHTLTSVFWGGKIDFPLRGPGESSALCLC